MGFHCILRCIMLQQRQASSKEIAEQLKFWKFPITFTQYYHVYLQLHWSKFPAVYTFSMIPIRLVSEVNGKTCMMVYEWVIPAGVRRCILDRSRLTRAKPTSSVHFTKATCQNKNVKLHEEINAMSWNVIYTILQKLATRQFSLQRNTNALTQARLAFLLKTYHHT